MLKNEIRNISVYTVFFTLLDTFLKVLSEVNFVHDVILVTLSLKLLVWFITDLCVMGSYPSQVWRLSRHSLFLVTFL